MHKLAMCTLNSKHTSFAFVGADYCMVLEFFLLLVTLILSSTVKTTFHAKRTIVLVSSMCCLYFHVQCRGLHISIVVLRTVLIYYVFRGHLEIPFGGHSMKRCAALIDLNGTLHVEDMAIPRAAEALERLRKIRPVKFVTNTTKVNFTNLVLKKI